MIVQGPTTLASGTQADSAGASGTLREGEAGRALQEHYAGFHFARRTADGHSGWVSETVAVRGAGARRP